MSGHSKWAQIKRQKGVADVKRGLTFTKLSNAITIAVRQGGGIGDPSQNFKLRLAVEAARAANMPKENIERAISRAAGKGEGSLTEITYEGFAPGGIAVVVEAATDNTQRTTSTVKSIFSKAGANFGQPGSVSYQFKSVGEVELPKNSKSFDDIFADAVNAGAEDVEDLGEEVVVYSKPHDLGRLKDSLTQMGYSIIKADLSLKPISGVDVEESMVDKLHSFISSLEELDDVQKVYTNAK